MAVRNLQSSLRQHGAPATVAILILAGANFLASWVSGGGDWNKYLLFHAGIAFPWTFLTYPFAADAADIIGIFFMIYWMWIIGASVERDLGTGKYLAFFGTMTVVPALMMWICNATVGHFVPLYGLYLPVAGITIAWASRNPNASMLFMMIIPILAKWLAWLTAALVVFRYGYPNPPVGLFAGVHLLLAYLYASNKIPVLPYGRDGGRVKKQQWLPREKDDKYLRDVKSREIERAERERLRKLFEGSLKDDPEDKR